MGTEQNKITARRFFAEQDRRKGPLAEELCAPHYTAAIVGNPVMDMASHSQFGQRFYAAFPDLEHIIEETVAERNKAVVKFTLHGTHQGSFFGIPPTGKQVTVSAMAILELVEGKVTQLHGIFDQMGLMQQLGVLLK